MATTDDLAPEHFNVVAMARTGFVGESLPEQVKQERLERPGELAANLDIAVDHLP